MANLIYITLHFCTKIFCFLGQFLISATQLAKTNDKNSISFCVSVVSERAWQPKGWKLIKSLLGLLSLKVWSKNHYKLTLGINSTHLLALICPSIFDRVVAMYLKLSAPEAYQIISHGSRDITLQSEIELGHRAMVLLLSVFER